MQVSGLSDFPFNKEMLFYYCSGSLHQGLCSSTELSFSYFFYIVLSSHVVLTLACLNYCSIIDALLIMFMYCVDNALAALIAFYQLIRNLYMYAYLLTRIILFIMFKCVM